MANDYFQFKKFLIRQSQCAMKVCTDSCLFGAWAARKISEQENRPERILDIGGGTGLLSLMLGQKTAAKIHAVEYDGNAFEQMQENFTNSDWSDRLKGFHSDIKNFTAREKYDLIISNPPFYENSLKGDDQARTAAMHDSGLLLGELVTEIQRNITPEGTFLILVAALREKDLEEIFKDHRAVILEKLLIKNTKEKLPFRIAYYGSFSPAEKDTVMTSITIYQQQGYTEAFRELLKDYYLYL
ncbi:MAG: methyltransferase [Chitinophagaceae bacterium]|nr:methyltransferase [Chitinophagaceae bacterium]